MEKYLAAAEKIAAEAIVTRWPPEKTLRTFAGNQLAARARGKRPEAGGRMDVEGEVYVDVDFPVNGDYVIRWRALWRAGRA